MKQKMIALALTGVFACGTMLTAAAAGIGYVEQQALGEGGRRHDESPVDAESGNAKTAAEV